MTKPIDKEKKRIEELIFYTLMRVVQNFPQYTLSQHLCHILRKKQELEEAYFWGDDKLLKKLEDYFDELQRELSVIKFDMEL